MQENYADCWKLFALFIKTHKSNSSCYYRVGQCLLVPSYPTFQVTIK